MPTGQSHARRASTFLVDHWGMAVTERGAYSFPF